MSRVDEIVRLIVEEAKERQGPDYVSRLYQVKVDVDRRVGEVMNHERKKEREQGIDQGG